MIEDRITVMECDVRTLTPETLGGEVGVAFANPPYMRKNSGFASPHKEKQTARHETEGGIAEFAAAAGKILKYGGLFYVVYRPDRLIDLISALRNNNLEPKNITFVYSNSATPPSILLLQAKKGAKSGLTIAKPLVMYKDNTTEYTDELKKIYESCEME